MKIKLFYSIIAGLFLAQLLAIFERPKPAEMYLRQVRFEQLPGWGKTPVEKSFQAFQISCRAFLKQNPEKPVGSQFIDMKVADWLPVCRQAAQLSSPTKGKIQQFFQTWFMPVEFREGQRVRGLFTGYYMPALQGSLTKTTQHTVPIYGVPSKMITVNLNDFSPDMVHKRLVGRVVSNHLEPFYTRAEINRGAIDSFTPIIAWVKHDLDRLMLEIEGSGIIKLDGDQQIAVGYAGENGAPYTSIAKILIDRGLMTYDNASMQKIRHYLQAHPQEVTDVFNQNKSFVFFRKLDNRSAVGSQGVPLTPGYSLAVDRKWVPMGTPLWLVTTRPDEKTTQKQRKFRRLMIAQDTGGAIRGPVRGDVYWGEGERATEIAGHMKNHGHYWLLLPRQVAERISRAA